jgi:hypothetical protein
MQVVQLFKFSRYPLSATTNANEKPVSDWYSNYPQPYALASNIAAFYLQLLKCAA